MKPGRTYRVSGGIALLASGIGWIPLQAQETGIIESIRSRLLFTQQTFGGNGRTCLTCHSFETGTVSPQDAFERYLKNRRDPLFAFDGSDNGNGVGVGLMIRTALALHRVDPGFSGAAEETRWFRRSPPHLE
jgi:hypothetical protein